MSKPGTVRESLGISEKIEVKSGGHSIPNMTQEKRTKTAVMSFQDVKDKSNHFEKYVKKQNIKMEHALSMHM